MKPTTLKERLGLDEEAVFEDGGATETGMTDEELKIESLKIATNIGKLMSNVTTEDIVSIAETVAKFIKGGDDAELETTTSDDNAAEEETEEPADSEEDFTTEEGGEEGDESDEENESEEPAESAEDFEL